MNVKRTVNLTCKQASMMTHESRTLLVNGYEVTNAVVVGILIPTEMDNKYLIEDGTGRFNDLTITDIDYERLSYAYVRCVVSLNSFDSSVSEGGKSPQLTVHCEPLFDSNLIYSHLLSAYSEQCQREHPSKFATQVPDKPGQSYGANGSSASGNKRSTDVYAAIFEAGTAEEKNNVRGILQQEPAMMDNTFVLDILAVIARAGSQQIVSLDDLYSKLSQARDSLLREDVRQYCTDLCDKNLMADVGDGLYQVYF